MIFCMPDGTIDYIVMNGFDIFKFLFVHPLHEFFKIFDTYPILLRVSFGLTREKWDFIEILLPDDMFRNEVHETIVAVLKISVINIF